MRSVTQPARAALTAAAIPAAPLPTTAMSKDPLLDLGLSFGCDNLLMSCGPAAFKFVLWDLKFEI
jgi:hypothetical protein